MTAIARDRFRAEAAEVVVMASKIDEREPRALTLSEAEGIHLLSRLFRRASRGATEGTGARVA